MDDSWLQFQIAVVTEKGITISESRSIKTEWAFAEGYVPPVSDQPITLNTY
jgi:hypothetical protein